jgi:HlyD family secretion protein
MSRTRTFLIAIGAVSLVASALALGSRGGSTATAAVSTSLESTRIVGPGRVEPISEEITIGVEVPGRVVALLADEGDEVNAGQLLAVLDNRDYQAAVASARARLASARSDLDRTRNGSRVEEKHEAGASVAQAEAVLRQAELDAARRQRLADEGIISREDRDRADRDVDVARARLAELTARRALVNAGPRIEDHAAAEAAVALAEATLREAEARLSKTEIRAPIAGVVLRRDSRIGETVSPDVPGTKLFVVADVSRLRVRVDVDETDVGRLAPGAPAYVTAATFGPKRFTGRVVRIGQSLGRKNVYTEEPRERVDTKILETLVELDPGMRLPVGLRVDATIETRAR